MGFGVRFRGRKESAPRLRWGLIGAGTEAECLVSAYQAEGAEPAVHAPVERAEEVLCAPGLQAVEIVAAPEAQSGLAKRCLSAGIHTSLGAPLALNLTQADELIRLAASRGVALRVRNPFLYYQPVLQAKRLLAEESIGRLETLKLMVKYGRGNNFSADSLSPEWWLRRESDFLALAAYFFGPVAKVYADFPREASSILMWKYQEKHQYGYLQLDFCPGLHVRTFTAPVARWIEITGTAGMLWIPRGEGQMLRGPALVLRGRDKTTAYEMVDDDFRQVWTHLAREMIQVVFRGRSVRSDGAISRQALALALAGVKSANEHQEINLAPD